MKSPFEVSSAREREKITFIDVAIEEKLSPNRRGKTAGTLDASGTCNILWKQLGFTGYRAAAPLISVKETKVAALNSLVRKQSLLKAGYKFER